VLAFHETPSRGIECHLIAICDHAVLPATWHKWTHPALTPAKKAGTRISYPSGKLVWVDLGGWLHADMVYPCAVMDPMAMHHYECVAPNVDIILQSGRFWATLIASFRERFNGSRSCWVVFIQVVRGRPGGLLLFSEGEAVKICLASDSSGIWSKHIAVTDFT